MENDYKVKSLAKAMHLLECFSVATPELGITELADMLSITKSNVFNIVSTFQQMGYIRRLPNGKYALGLHMLEYAFIINQQLGYPKAVYDVLMETAEKTNQLVYFGIPYGMDVLYLYVVHPIARLKELPYREILGEKTLLCATGIGRAMLAFMPESEWDSRIPDNVPKFTPNTLTGREEIKDELRRTRERGYAIDNVERELNIRCVGMPVYNAQGELIAGMSTSGPASIMTDEMLERCSEILQVSATKMRNRIYR